MEESPPEACSRMSADSLLHSSVPQPRSAGEATGGVNATKASGPTLGVQEAARRCLDIGIAVIALLLLLLPMAIIAAAIRLTMGAPVLFRQVRPGLAGRPFEIYKFRTMAHPETTSREGHADEERLGRLGRFLRRTSLDELPELFNVLKGDMSLVGPRPLLMEYLELYTPEQARRHEVRPGMTGWAQINGRNAITWEEKFERDVWYVDNRNIWLDLKILMLTAVVVLQGRGVNQPGQATVENFRGTDAQRSAAGGTGIG